MSLWIAERGGLNDSGLGNYMESGASRRGAGVWGKGGKLVFGLFFAINFLRLLRGGGNCIVLCKIMSSFYQMLTPLSFSIHCC